MLPLFRKRRRIHLYSDRLTVSAGEGAPATVSSSQYGDAKGAALLAAWLAEHAAQRLAIDLIVSDDFVRYATVPWSDQIANSAELAMAARAQLEAAHGDALAGWEVRVDMGDYQKDGLACAISNDLIQSVQAACAAHGVALRSLQPAFMVEFNRSAGTFAKDEFLFACESEGYAMLAYRDAKGWRSVRQVRKGGQALDDAIAREKLLLGCGEGLQVYGVNHA